MDETRQPGVAFDRVYLKSVEYRLADPLPDKAAFNLDIGADVEVTDDGSFLRISFVVDAFHGLGNDAPALLKFVLVGEFSIVDDDKNLDLPSFAENQAPAILFPYVRQVISQLTGWTPYGPLLLPPINLKAILVGDKLRRSTTKVTPAVASQPSEAD